MICSHAKCAVLFIWQGKNIVVIIPASDACISTTSLTRTLTQDMLMLHQ